MSLREYILKGYPNDISECVHCGYLAYYCVEDASFFHIPPYAWGNDDMDGPDWQNGYYCDRERTQSALI